MMLAKGYDSFRRMKIRVGRNLQNSLTSWMKLLCLTKARGIRISAARVSEMRRPADEDYYVDKRTEHVAQGDIFRDLSFRYFVPQKATSEQAGKRQPLEKPPSFSGYGMLINYTSGFMAQPEGTRGYGHHFRVVAPIFPFAMMADLGVGEETFADLRRADHFNYYMYLPAYPGEFPESAVILLRPVLVHHDLLENRRVTQLRERAAKQLQQKLSGMFLGKKWPLESYEPDLRDHWNLPKA